MKYKGIVFFDLDGTLFDASQTVPPENIKALDQLQKNNILPVISTGRSIFEISDLLEETGINTVVSANGSYVMYQNEPLIIENIETDLINQVVKFANKYDEAIGFYNDREATVDKDNAIVQDNYRALGQKMVVNPEFPQNNVINFLLTYSPVGSKADKTNAYQTEFAEKLTFYRNNPRALDTVKYGVSKGTGIMKLIKAASLSSIPTYGFGDGYNDLPMFQVVDHAVVMQNGVPEAKEVGEYITKKDNTQGGIIEGLKHYNLL